MIKDEIIENQKKTENNLKKEKEEKETKEKITEINQYNNKHDKDSIRNDALEEITEINRDINKLDKEIIDGNELVKKKLERLSSELGLLSPELREEINVNLARHNKKIYMESKERNKIIKLHHFLFYKKK